MNEIVAMILGIIGTVLTALASWAVERLINYLNKKIKNAKAAEYLTNATDVISNVVKQIYQTYVENIKGTEAWTIQAQENALNQAKQKAQVLLTTDVKNYISETFGDLQAWLIAAIEAKIYDLKKSYI